MDQNPFFVLPALLLASLFFCAVATVVFGALELAFFRDRGGIGHGAKQRKQYVNNVVKAILSAGAGAIAAIVFLEPGLWREVLPRFPAYAPAVSLIAVAIAAVITYKMEVASEVPDTLHDLHSDLRKSWAEEEILSKHSLARHRNWLEGFKTTDGGRSMTSSRRSLDTQYQAAIDLSLNGNYRDIRFTRLSRRTTSLMVRAMIQGHPWIALWLLLPLVSAVLGVAFLSTVLAEKSLPPTPGLAFLYMAAIIVGTIFSAFNIWARSTSRLRKYCDLKRREELCSLMLNKLKVLAEPAKAITTPHQPNPPGLIRRLFRAIW